MYNKLFVAPLALSFALAAVAPTMAQAEEAVAVSDTVEATTTVSFDLWYKGAVNDTYTGMFGAATVTPVGNQYEVTLEVPQMLTTFNVNGVTPETVAETATFKTVKFTTASVTERLPITIGYTVNGYTGSHDMELALNYNVGGGVVTPPVTETPEATQPIAVSPIISYKGVPTASYNTNFQQVSYVKDGDGYKVMMDIAKILTTFKVNGADVTPTDNGETNQVTFNVQDLNNTAITIGYNVGGYAATHDFIFDFTPSKTEIQPAWEQAIKAITTTPITSAAELKVAAAQIATINGVIAAAQASLSEADAAAFVAPETYTKQVAAIAAYKTPFVTAATDAFSKLSFTEAGSITTEAQLATATAQVAAAQAAITNALAAGLTERADLAGLAGYANVTAQKAVVEVGVKAPVEKAQTVRTLTGKVSNVKGAEDIVKVYGLQKGDTIRLYNATGKVLKTATATGAYLRVANVSLGKAASKLFVTAQASDEKESVKKAISFKAEPVAKAIAKTQIHVKNNKGQADIVTVKGTAHGQKVRVYNEAGKSLKTVTATGKTTKISIKQLGKAAGKISVARIQAGKHMSAKTTVKFSKEQH